MAGVAHNSKKTSTVTVGVLAVQGDFIEHIAVLKALDIQAREVRLPQELTEVDGLIIPGGESTTIARLMDIYGLRELLIKRARQGLPVWGTCAGMIVMAKRLTDDRPQPMELMDIDVSRNAFGRQVDSFEADLKVKDLDGTPFRAVFIRAPVISRVGEDVVVLARLDDGRPVAVKQDNLLATAFHPELTNDARLHSYFVSLVEKSRRANA